MKLTHLLAGAAAAAALPGCKDDGPTFVTNGPQAYVRYVNASPDSPRLTARFVDKVENMFTWDRVGFRGNSGNYIAVNAGTRNLRVFLAGQSNTGTTLDTAGTVVLDTTFTLQAQTYYTVVQSGRVLPKRGAAPNNAAVTVFVDTLPASGNIAAGSVLLRVYNLAEGAGPLDVVATSNAAGSAPAATITGVAFGRRSAYATVPALVAPALYTFALNAAGAPTAIGTATPDVAGQGYAAASVSSPELLPVGGVRQGRSVLSLFVFPAGVAGTPAAAATAVSADLLPDQSPPKP